MPGHGQTVLKVMASSICGGDLRAIYRHEGEAADPSEEYHGVICGHEPAGIIEEVGPGVSCFKVGDRAVEYHVSGCGVCRDYREGTVISCEIHRQSYGYQCNGGMGECLLADEQSLVPLPDELSYVDGAVIAWGVGTAYESLLRANVNGNDRGLITGLGPVGLSVRPIAQALGAKQVIGVDLSEDCAKHALAIGAVTDVAFSSGDDAFGFIRSVTGGDLAEGRLRLVG